MASEIAYANTVSQTAACVAVVGVLLALLCLTILHVVRSDLDPSRRMMSEYALGANGWLMTLCFASYALAGVGLAVALLAGPARDRALLFWIGLLFLIAAAAGPALASVFPTDPASAAPQVVTPSGKLHGLSFVIGVPGELLAMLLLTLVLHHRAPWLPGTLLIALTALAWVSVIVLAATMFLTIGQQRADPGIVGSANRVFMIAYGLWVAVAAWPLAVWSATA